MPKRVVEEKASFKANKRAYTVSLAETDLGFVQDCIQFIVAYETVCHEDTTPLPDPDKKEFTPMEAALVVTIAAKWVMSASETDDTLLTALGHIFHGMKTHSDWMVLRDTFIKRTLRVRSEAKNLFGDPSTDDKIEAGTLATAVPEIDEKAQLRLRALLHLALNCIYLQSSDDVQITLGREKDIAYDLYDEVISDEDAVNVFVSGYNAQGYAKAIPNQIHYKDMEEYMRADAEASFVKVSWIISHLVLAPDGPGRSSPDFKKGVALVKRAAETMILVSNKIYNAAQNLASGLGIKAKVLKISAAVAIDYPTESISPLLMENAWRCNRLKDSRPFNAPRLADDFVQLIQEKTYTVDPSTKDAKRLAFESEVLDVFSFGVCIAYNHWKNLGDIMLSNSTHLRKCYDEMTQEERTATGSVVLQTIMDELKAGRNEEAIIASLAAASALDRNARRLEVACAAVMKPSADDTTLTTAAKKIDDKAQLRQKALLHLALNCFYLQSSQDIYMTLGARLNYDLKKLYGPVVSDADTFHVLVLGYNAQGEAQELPDPKHYETPEEFKRADAESSFVKLSWITSHLVLKPDGDGMYSPDFLKGVALVKRAAETMVRVSCKIYETAIDLADGLGIKDKVRKADEAAEAALVVPTDPLPALVIGDVMSNGGNSKDPRPFTAPRLAYDFIQIIQLKTYAVDPDTKDAKRRAFESEIFDVFSFGVCIANDHWKHLGEIMLSSTTHLRKCYDEMTPEERKATGSVVLQNITNDLKEGCNEEAIIASLAAVRALDRNARRLEVACAAVADV